MTTVDSWPKTLPMPSVGSWNSTTETHLIASTETNATSKERSDTQLFGGGKFEVVALPGGFLTFLLQKYIDQKVNLTKQRQDAKRKISGQSYSYIIRKVWCHQIWIWKQKKSLCSSYLTSNGKSCLLITFSSWLESKRKRAREKKEKIQAYND